MKRSCSSLLAVATFASLGGGQLSRAEEIESYKGKSIRLIVGTEAGGGYDAYARIVARHLGNHLPGGPSVIVENMIGAGGVVAANYIYNAAAKNGTVIATFPNDTPFLQILGQPGPMFQASKFGWLGSLASETTVCVAKASTGMENISDLMRTPLLIGGSGPNNTETTPAVLNAILGTKFQIITGYASSTATALAVDRGEVEGLCTSYNTMLTRNPDWLAQGKVRILIQSGLRKDERISAIPLDMDLAKSPGDRQVLELNNARLELGRPFVAPPNLSAGRLAQLRSAFEGMEQDGSFLADVKRAGLEVFPIDGAGAQRILERVFGTPVDIIERLNRALHYRIQDITPKR